MSDVPANTIELPARLDVPAAEALLTELLEYRGSDADLVVKGSDVGLIDTPAIQILMSAARDQAARKRAFTLNDPSAAIREAMELMGLENELATWRGSNE
ncbi:STAS domain-containing protein [Maricaulis sp.]|uniref:STAS domain-containing protein n=1 Tax=unclassified Maricaulis TaxID=2632371 RepID=UPI001B223B3A|nr:STAS domain-containing protein [Maricaulis sp.]MBO6795550.1 STAS domain-containing protein [Maricaulis sp.]